MRSDVKINKLINMDIHILLLSIQTLFVVHKMHPTRLNTAAGLTKLNKVDIASLEQVKFGFGLSRGGVHIWFFSKGKVYEVHWDKIGSDLYEATSLRRFSWLSGAIVVPGDQAAFLSAASKLKCGR